MASASGVAQTARRVSTAPSTHTATGPGPIRTASRPVESRVRALDPVGFET